MDNSPARTKSMQVAGRWRVVWGMVLLLASGTTGVLAAVIRWTPCWGEPEGLACASLMNGDEIPGQRFFLLWGLADLFLVGALVFLMRGLGPKLLARLIQAGLAVAGTGSLVYGVGATAWGPVAWNVGIRLWWFFIPLLSFVFVARMLNVWQADEEARLAAGGGPRHAAGAAEAAGGWTALVLVAVVLGAGLSEFIILSLFVDTADSPYGSDGLRYALFVLIGIAMAGSLLWSGIRAAVAARV